MCGHSIFHSFLHQKKNVFSLFWVSFCLSVFVHFHIFNHVMNLYDYNTAQTTHYTYLVYCWRRLWRPVVFDYSINGNRIQFSFCLYHLAVMHSVRVNSVLVLIPFDVAILRPRKCIYIYRCQSAFFVGRLNWPLARYSQRSARYI